MKWPFIVILLFRTLRECAPTTHRRHVYLELCPLPDPSINSVDQMKTVLISYCQDLWEALVEVSDQYLHTKDVCWQLGFYCLSTCLQTGRSPRPAVCLTNVTWPQTTPKYVVYFNDSCFEEASCKYRIWFEVRNTWLLHSACVNCGDQSFVYCFA